MKATMHYSSIATDSLHTVWEYTVKKTLLDGSKFRALLTCKDLASILLTSAANSLAPPGKFWACATSMWDCAWAASLLRSLICFCAARSSSIKPVFATTQNEHHGAGMQNLHLHLHSSSNICESGTMILEVTSLTDGKLSLSLQNPLDISLICVKMDALH